MPKPTLLTGKTRVLKEEAVAGVVVVNANATIKISKKAKTADRPKARESKTESNIIVETSASQLRTKPQKLEEVLVEAEAVVVEDAVEIVRTTARNRKVADLTEEVVKTAVRLVARKAIAEAVESAEVAQDKVVVVADALAIIKTERLMETRMTSALT